MKSKTRIIGVFFMAACLLVVVLTLLASKEQKETKELSHTEVKSAEVGEVQRDRTSKIRESVNNLKFANLDKRIRDLEETVEDKETDTDLDSNKNNSQKSKHESIPVEETAEYILDKMENDIETQVYDPEWSSRTVSAVDQDLQNMITNNENMEFDVLQVDCKSNSCVAELSFKNYNAVRKASMEISAGNYSVECERSLIAPVPTDQSQPYTAKFFLTNCRR